MIKKLMLLFVVAFVTLTVIVAALTARNGNRRRPLPSATQTNKMLNLDTSPPQFPER